MNAALLDSFIQGIVSFLLTIALYGIVAAAAASIVLAVLPRVSAAFRAGLLFAAILASFVSAVEHTMNSFDRQATAIRTSIPLLRSRAGPAGPVKIPVRGQTPAATTTPLFQWGSLSPLSISPRLADTVALAWLIIVLSAMARLVIGLLHMRGALKTTTLLSDALSTDLNATIRSRTNIRVTLRAATASEMPLALGLMHSAVLVPAWMIEELNRGDMQRVVLHEVAHLRRNDALLTVITDLVVAFAALSPGLIWLRRRLNIERELACDEWAIGEGPARDYAICLTNIAMRLSLSGRALLSKEALLGSSGTFYRIQSLATGKRSTGGPIKALLAAGVAIVGLWLIAASPAIAITSGSQSVTAYLDDLDRLGYRGTSASDLILLRSLHVPIEYVGAIQNAGLHATVRDIADLHSMTVAPSYVASMLRIFPSATALDIMRLGSLRVSITYVTDVSRHLSGYDPASIIEMRRAGVSLDYLQMLERYSYEKLDAERVVALKTVGIDDAFLSTVTQQGRLHPSLVSLMKERLAR